jgi:hypothetical protein
MRRRLALAFALTLALATAAACSPPGAQVSMSFARASLYDAPFPSDDLLRKDGTVDVSQVPNPHADELMTQALALLTRDAHGFALAGATFFRSSAPIDPRSLPDAFASVRPDASVFMVGLDASQSDFLKPRPVDVAFLADGGPFGDRNLIVVLPLQGVPLHPRARYAAVVTTRVLDAAGNSLSQSPEMAALAVGRRPDGMPADTFVEYVDALATISARVGSGDVAGLAVFTTDDPTAAVRVVRDDAQAAHPISAPLSPPQLGDEFDDYCVYDTTVRVPVYQSGTPPYSKVGGDWKLDGAGRPLFDHEEVARVVITIPRAPMPAGGWPTVVFIRTGGGGDRPLVDRGVSETEEFTVAITRGSGPARELARVGFAGVQIDGPLGGARNTSGGDEQFLTFNVFNPAALRDNVRQAALELALVPRALGAITVDSSACAGSSPSARFDGAHLALMGHSMGGWIAPLALSAQPAYGAAVLSGAGGSYIANVIDKIKPLTVRPLAAALLDYDMDGRELVAHDPALTYVQWAAEPSDPQVYDLTIVREPPPGEAPRHVLMLQGIVDHYIMPSIANATSLALGLDEAGPAYDVTSDEEWMLHQRPLGALVGLAGRAKIALPAAANATAPDGQRATAVVVQHRGDAIEDGHEVMFQTEPPKHQYRCFLAGFARGAPSVPPDGAADAPCP